MSTVAPVSFLALRRLADGEWKPSQNEAQGVSPEVRSFAEQLRQRSRNAADASVSSSRSTAPSASRQRESSEKIRNVTAETSAGSRSVSQADEERESPRVTEAQSAQPSEAAQSSSLPSLERNPSETPQPVEAPTTEQKSVVESENPSPVSFMQVLSQQSASGKTTGPVRDQELSQLATPVAELKSMGPQSLFQSLKPTARPMAPVPVEQTENAAVPVTEVQSEEPLLENPVAAVLPVVEQESAMGVPDTMGMDADKAEPAPDQETSGPAIVVESLESDSTVLPALKGQKVDEPILPVNGTKEISAPAPAVDSELAEPTADSTGESASESSVPLYSGSPQSPLMSNLNSTHQQAVSTAADQTSAGEIKMESTVTTTESTSPAVSVFETPSVEKFYTTTDDGLPEKSELVSPSTTAQQAGTDTASKTAGTGLKLDVNSQDFTEKLTAYFQAASQSGKALKIRLNPPELGTLQIEVSRLEGKTVARLEVESAAAKTVILEQLHVLRESLQQQGLKLEQIEVEINEQLGQSLNGDQERSEQFHGHSPEGDPDVFGAGIFSDEPADETEIEKQISGAGAVTRGEIDVQI